MTPSHSSATVTPAVPPAPPRRPWWQRSPASSLRGRVLLHFMLVMTLATLASIVFQRQALMGRLDDKIEADLTQEVTELRQLVGGADPDGNCVGEQLDDGSCEVGRDPETGEPFGNDIEALFDTFLRRNVPPRYETMITFVDGQPYKVPAIRSDLAAQSDGELLHLADTTEPAQGEVATDQGRLRYLSIPVYGTGGDVLGVFAVAQFVDIQAADVDQILRVIAAMGLVLLLVASALAFRAAGGVIAPVREVTNTARAISDTDLSRRIQVEGTDEIAGLAHTFNQMLDRLETAFVAQRNFVDDAGHELRTPITIIRGHLELLGDDPAERKETVALVTDELDRMARMVDDLLVLARAERPDFLRLDTVDLAPLSEELISKAEALADRDWRTEHIGQGRIVADEQRITQAVMQLAHNATQHTGPGDTITLGSAVTDGEVRFWVRDTGPGVSADDAERIFQRFARGAASRRRTEGSGLGLSIVRAIAEAHAGRVELRSTPGAGATFTLIIPVDPPTAGADALVAQP